MMHINIVLCRASTLIRPLTISLTTLAISGGTAVLRWI
jgi:hypothetical protein